MYSKIQWWLNCWRFAFFELQLDDESSDEEDGSKKIKVYVPPKVAAVPYGEILKAFYFNINISYESAPQIDQWVLSLICKIILLQTILHHKKPKHYSDIRMEVHFPANKTVVLRTCVRNHTMECIFGKLQIAPICHYGWERDNMSTDSLLIKTIFVANEHALGGNSSDFEGWHYFVYSSGVTCTSVHPSLCQWNWKV